jgi:hypothetical protein
MFHQFHQKQLRLDQEGWVLNQALHQVTGEHHHLVLIVQQQAVNVDHRLLHQLEEHIILAEKEE